MGKDLAIDDRISILTQAIMLSGTDLEMKRIGITSLNLEK